MGSLGRQSDWLSQLSFILPWRDHIDVCNWCMVLVGGGGLRAKIWQPSDQFLSLKREERVLSLSDFSFSHVGLENFVTTPANPKIYVVHGKAAIQSFLVFHPKET
eukprot:scaffold3632_cov162-Amphora_coffeaeformis.AAC.18